MSLAQARAEVLGGDAVDLSPDPVLEDIVRDVAIELDAPWAALNLLLERTLLVRAHHGLPMCLAVVRSMESDGAFCERVVLERTVLEVVDALASPETRLPYERYGVRSYLGVPLFLDDVCVGSLCLLDQVPRRFDPSARVRLAAYGARAAARLAELAGRPTLRRGLEDHALRSPFAELGNRLIPLLSQSEAAARALDQLMLEHELTRIDSSDALGRIATAIQGIEAESTRIRATIASLQAMLVGSSASGVGHLGHVASELAYHHTKLVGGVRWVTSSAMPALCVSNRIAVAVVTSALSLLAMDMNRAGTRTGIDACFLREDEHLVVSIQADVDAEQLRACAATVSDLVDDGKIGVVVDDRALRIALPVI